MNYLIPPILGLIITLLNLLCPVLMIFALPFARWDKEPSTARDESSVSIVRGDLPRWLSWFSTPDERLPGGMYEPTVLAFYLKHGKWLTSWYWLGVRNCLMGMAVALGRPTTDYIPEQPLGLWQRGDIWRYSLPLGLVKLVFGYQVYRVLNGDFWAAPVFTIKRY